MGFDLTNFLAFIQKGGIFIYPIILSSIVGLTLFLQKMWVLKEKNVMPEHFLRDIHKMISHNKLDSATTLAAESESSIGRIAFTALNNSHKDKESLHEDIEEAGMKEAQELGRYTEGLGTISTVSTLLGLLGTISGMIKVFSVISSQTVVNPQSLAAGISEALYTTAFGLSVAIPAFIAYKYFSSKVDNIVTDLEIEGRNLMEKVIEANRAAATPIDLNREPHR